MRSNCGSRWASLFALALATLAGNFSFAADHRDAPLIIGNEKQDINDIYAFQSPSNSKNVVFILTTNPFIGMFAEDGTLDPKTIYEFKIDTNGDAIQDLAYTFYFSSPNSSGRQNFIMQSGRSTLARGRTEQKVAVKGGGFVQVSIQDDPFFFDSGSVPGGSGTFGVDSFGGFNVTCITLEIPRRNLRTDNIGVWAITEVQGKQIDRVGRPGINTVIIPDNRFMTDRRDAFNQAEPVNDKRDFKDDVINVLMTDLGRNETDATNLADLLLPDILTIDTSNAGGFVPGLNGRNLAEDVIDFELQVLTGNPMATDGVDANDATFSNTFPYLAPPQTPPT